MIIEHPGHVMSVGSEVVEQEIEGISYSVSIIKSWSFGSSFFFILTTLVCFLSAVGLQQSHGLPLIIF